MHVTPNDIMGNVYGVRVTRCVCLHLLLWGFGWYVWESAKTMRRQCSMHSTWDGICRWTREIMAKCNCRCRCSLCHSKFSHFHTPCTYIVEWYAHGRVIWLFWYSKCKIAKLRKMKANIVSLSAIELWNSLLSNSTTWLRIGGWGLVLFREKKEDEWPWALIVAISPY